MCRIILWVAIVFLSGCSGVQVPEHAWASVQFSPGATYEFLQTFAGQTETGQVSLSLRTTQEMWQVHVQTSVSNSLQLNTTPPVAGGPADAFFDRRTGLLSHVVQDQVTLWPIEGNEYFLQPTDFFPSAVYAPYVVPFGPQLFLGNKSGEVQSRLGDSVLQGQVTATGWSVTVSEPCVWHCFENGFPIEKWHLQMNGTREVLLPVQAEWSSVPAGYSLRLRDVRFEPATQSNQLRPVVPSPQVSYDLQDCGFIPCEPQSWPPSASFKLGFAALKNDSAWTSWDVRNDARPYAFTVQSTPLYPSVPEPQQLAWTFAFSNPNSTSIRVFRLESTGVLSLQKWTAPKVTQASNQDLEDLPGLWNPSSPLATWASVKMASGCSLNPEDASALGMLWPTAHSAGNPYHPLAIWSDGAIECASSLRTGQPWFQLNP